MLNVPSTCPSDRTSHFFSGDHDFQIVFPSPWEFTVGEVAYCVSEQLWGLMWASYPSQLCGQGSGWMKGSS